MPPSLICQTVTATTMSQLIRRRDAARRADLVELRLDGVVDPDVRAAMAGRHLPVIVTCRPVWEGGKFTGSEEDRRRLLEQAIDAGAEYVDLEARAEFATALVARTHGRGVVLSYHDFDGVPADLGRLYDRMRSTGAQIVKIAVTARKLCDVFALEDLGATPLPAEEGRGAVLIAMGAPGIVTRILPGRFGSLWTYAGDAAPGQLSADVLLERFRFRNLLSTTAVYGVAGSLVSRSRSPELHNAAFAAMGTDAVFIPFETADFDDFLAFADRLPIAGASVTMPFKEAALRSAREADDLSRRVGAANTLRRSASGWCATNTDVDGFLSPIRDVPLEGCRVAILGAGGAARAVAMAMASRGARVSVFARRLEQASAVARIAKGDAFQGLPERGSWDVLVNATPVGSAPRVDETPLDAARLDGGGLVYDVVYDPPVTRLLREARAAGCRTVGGLDMLVAQAVRQSEWWTGRRPDESVMVAALGSGL